MQQKYNLKSLNCDKINKNSNSNNVSKQNEIPKSNLIHDQAKFKELNTISSSSSNTSNNSSNEANKKGRIIINKVQNFMSDYKSKMNEYLNNSNEQEISKILKNKITHQNDLSFKEKTTTFDFNSVHMEDLFNKQKREEISKQFLKSLTSVEMKDQIEKGKKFFKNPEFQIMYKNLSEFDKIENNEAAKDKEVKIFFIFLGYSNYRKISKRYDKVSKGSL